MLKFVIPLNPVTKKNGNVRTKNGVIPSKAYRKYEHDALLVIPPKVRKHIRTPTNIKATYYTKIDYIHSDARIDLTNLHNALCDVLVAAGVIADDNCKIVCSMDGSRVRHDRRNPRTEIEIEEAEP